MSKLFIASEMNFFVVYLENLFNLLFRWHHFARKYQSIIIDRMELWRLPRKRMAITLWFRSNPMTITIIVCYDWLQILRFDHFLMFCCNWMFSFKKNQTLIYDVVRDTKCIEEQCNDFKNEFHISTGHIFNIELANIVNDETFNVCIVLLNSIFNIEKVTATILGSH